MGRPAPRLPRGHGPAALRVMISRQPFLAAFLGAALVMSGGCSNGPEVTPAMGVSVPPLREWLPALEQEARTWRPDAYLADVHIPIGLGGSHPWLISAGFNSPTDVFENIAVNVEMDGSITVEPFTQTLPVVQVEPITDQDWTIDSQEALNLTLDAEGLRFLQTEPVQFSALYLLAPDRQRARHVVWRLLLSQSGEYQRTIILDASSGGILPTPY